MLYSFSTEIDIPILNYLASYTGLNSIFDCIMQAQFSYRIELFIWLFGWYLQTLLILPIVI